jgi:hypothetical protein
MRRHCRSDVIVRRLSERPRSIKGPVALIVAGVLVVVALVVVLAVGSGGSSGGASPAADRGPRTAPLQSIFESDVELDADPVKTLALFHSLGVDRVRVFVPWGALGGRVPIAPDPLSKTRPRFDATDPAAYPPSGWTLYDAIVRAAAAQKIGLDFTLGPPAPGWATGPGEPRNGGGSPGPTGIWKVSATDFGQFVRAVARRYGGHFADPLHPGQTLPRVDFWAIWNEPNLGIDLAPQAVRRGSVEVSPRLYRGMVDAAWSALQGTGHGRDTILIGELAPDGSTVPPQPGNFDMMPGLRFLRALYCVDASYRRLTGAAARERGCPASTSGSASFAAENPALFHASGFADHPYTQGQPPNQPTPDEPDYTDFPALPRLESTLDRLQRAYGSNTRLPIFSTEFGYWTNPPTPAARADSPPTAAAYMNWAEYLSWRDPRIHSYDQYLLEDSPTGVFPSGLKFAGGAPKPSYAAFRLPLYLPVTTGTRGTPLEVWGCVRPAGHAGTRVDIQFSGGAGRFQTVRTVTLPGPSCYFDVRQAFAGSGSVRLEWSHRGGARIVSRTVRLALR